MNIEDANKLEHAISTVRWAVEKAVSIVSCGPYGNRVGEPQFVTLDIIADTVVVKWPSAHLECGSPVVEAESISIPISRLLMTEKELGRWERAVCDQRPRAERGIRWPHPTKQDTEIGTRPLPILYESLSDLK